MEQIHIKNSLGQDISGVVESPKVESDKLAILCPGYLDTKEYAHLVALSLKLSEKGYVVVRFDPTGTWESEGDISQYTTTQYLNDIRSVLEYMLTQKAYTEVLLGGHSRGGQVSLLYASRDSRITEVVAIMPSSGTLTGPRRDEWEKNSISISDRDLPNAPDEKREYRIPFSHILDRDKYDVVKEVEKIKVPILFIAGASDVLVPPEDVKELYDKANEPKKYILLSGIGHDYRKNPTEVELVTSRIMEELFKE